MITQQKDTEPVKKTLAASSALAILMGLAVPAVAAEQAPRKTVGRLDTKPLADLHPDMAYAIKDQAESQANRAAQEAAYKKASQEAARHKAAAQAKARPKTAPAAMPETPDGTPAWVIAINWAQTKLGVKYVWGGDSMSEGGYDCSGLTMRAFEQAGIQIPRVANDQYAASNNHPQRHELKPGDMVFYGQTERGIHHVALYLGGGMVIHAPKPGTKVRFNTIAEAGSDYYGATRVS